MAFYDELKKCISRQDENFIWLGNVEVEQHWGKEDIISLPGSNISKSQPLVNKIGEMGLFLAGQNDIVCLKDNIDEDYAQYIEDIRGFIPEILSFHVDNSDINISETILCNKESTNLLQKINVENKYSLLPYGTSRLEEEISIKTSIPLSTPKVNVCQEVNSKLYSWDLSEKFELRQVTGNTSRSIDELEENYKKIRKKIGDKPLVLKDSMGVSGKGMVLIDSENKFINIMNLLRRSSRKKGHTNIEMLLESWIEKERDLNYQFLIDRRGNVTFTSVREALVYKGVHLGHKLPVNLTPVQEVELERAYKIIGKQLAESGYYGVVGVDAMIDTKGLLYPCVEINARFNMATYQNEIVERFVEPEMVFTAIPLEITLKKLVPFNKIKKELKDILYTKEKGYGVIINGFSTLNLGINKKGRLYTIILGHSTQHCKEMNEKLKGFLRDFGVER
ncbi:hypothetical protein COK37_20845 [Bacillus thuringiensis]|uniref:ATP-binding protein n=1 Tax=Bacillus thuringiensis TaxID=1428 RepID=UPI000BF2C39F|nr:ATP-grasp domain-containing protein [Bacillus thuringiensis]PEV50781.1 hypothetical protein CN432_09260 [Bacillus thuringiensis]PFR65803.1 hypothetical protein COK37_20845 [Bacillus thuringiensis]PFT77402.1 hypothetical protein COK70_19620 [Bacillus thuringiensis]PFV87953.1 hypothetical protein COL06_15305 [Bacillus thuringiensis]